MFAEKTAYQFLVLFASRVMQTLLCIGMRPFEPITDPECLHSLFDDIMGDIAFYPHHHDPEQLAADHWECRGWVTPGSNKDNRTGRIFRLGEPVWLHDRDGKTHPIVAKGILLRFDTDAPEHNIRVEDGLHLLCCDCYTTIYPIEGEVNCGGGKLWCVEPIQEDDLLKSVAQIQAERDEIEDKCRDIEHGGRITLRMALNAKRSMQTTIIVIGATEAWLEEDQQRWHDFIVQVCKQENVTDIKELKLWVVLIGPAIKMYGKWKAH